jgi:nucleoside-diphosphate-sugar epimerase
MTRILLAGGTGVIGRRLAPALVAAGHEVVATTRRPDRIAQIEAGGASGVVVDVFDADRTSEVVAQVAPELILHELTDLGANDRDANARLRREGTAHLVAAARAAGVARMIVQSIAWGAQPGTAVDDMERMARTLPHATILRYGLLYGPGTWYPERADAAAAGIDSLAHLDVVIAATVQSLDWPDGTYEIDDDAPGGRMVG